MVSDLSGRASMELKAKELGIELEPHQLQSVLEELKALENTGYHFEVADASLELLMRGAAGWEPDYFHSRASTSPCATPEWPEPRLERDGGRC